MAVTIRRVTSKKDLKEFIKFPVRLYRHHAYHVPAINDFELGTLQKSKNPAFDHAQAQYFLAIKNNLTVGRIAAIILQHELEEKKLMRFGWVDFIDDVEVVDALFGAAEQWGQTSGCQKIHGPLGFTDLDFEGALISGYDRLATQATIYNFPYYISHYERLGFVKACDWVELRGTVPTEMPKKLERSAQLISSRFKIYPKIFTKTKQTLAYGKGVFSVLNKAYSNLYGYHPLSEKQIEYYIKLYFGFVRVEFVSLIVNEKDEVVAFGISLPSLSKAFQKAKGKLFPFGFIHILKAFYFNKDVDMFLIGVSPDYQKLGANVLIFHEILKAYIKNGIKNVASGPMMETNKSVLNLWADYPDHASDFSIKRRCYIKDIK